MTSNRTAHRDAVLKRAIEIKRAEAHVLALARVYARVRTNGDGELAHAALMESRERRAISPHDGREPVTP